MVGIVLALLSAESEGLVIVLRREPMGLGYSANSHWRMGRRPGCQRLDGVCRFKSSQDIPAARMTVLVSPVAAETFAHPLAMVNRVSPPPFLYFARSLAKAINNATTSGDEY